MQNKEQIYGRNDMILLDKHNKIYGSLGIIEPYVFDTKTGETIVMENPKKGKFEDAVTEFNVYGKSTQQTTKGINLLDPNKDSMEFIPYPAKAGTYFTLMTNGVPSEGGNILFKGEDDSEVLFPIDKGDFRVYRKIEKNVSGFYIQLSKTVELKYMFAEGDVKEYEPYTGGKPSPSIEYPQEIVSVGDKGEVSIGVYGGNLFNVGAEPSDNDYNYQNYIKNNGIYIKNMKRYEALRFKFTVQKYTDITLSAKILSKDSFVQLSNFGLGGSEISESILFGGKHNITVNTAEHNEIVISFYSSANIVEYKVEDVIVNVGSNNLTFEPYKDPQTLALTTPNGLPGVPVDKNGNYIDTNGQLWAVDEKDLARGKYVQRIYITEINESMIKTVIINWEKEDKISYKITTNLPAKQNQKCLSNRFVHGSYPYLVAISGKSIYFEFVDKKEMPTVEKFKQFLTDNKTTVAYILETPIEHDLTPEVIEQFKQLKTNYPTTVIMNDENAGMKVTYKQLESKTKAVN